MRPVSSAAARSSIFFRRLILPAIFAIGGAAFFPSAAALATDSAVPSPEEVRQQTLRAVEDYSLRRKRGIDPRLVDQLTNNILIFTSNFCFSPGSPECLNNFRNSIMFSAIIDEYLDRLVTDLPAETQSIADRLAEGNLGRAGWPSALSLEIGIVQVPERFQGAKSSLRTATGSLPLPTKATVILMTTGRASIEFESPDSRHTFNVAVEPGARLALEGVSDNGAGDERGDLVPPNEAFCYSSPAPAGPVKSLSMFNWGRATFSEDPTIRERNLAPFTQQPTIVIKAEIAPTFECGDDCQANIGALFAQAIAVWRSGCSRCDPNALTLVSFGKSFWIDWRLWKRLAEVRAGKTVGLHLGRFLPGEAERLKVSPAWFGQSMVVPYKEISEDEVTRRQICALSNTTAKWVKSAQYRICDIGTSSPHELRPTISFTDKETSCGLLAVACGLTYGNVEVNGAEYQFHFNSYTSVDGHRIGSKQSLNATMELWPVILHEVGHWFGVPHSEIAENQAASDIMVTEYGMGSPCVSSQSLTMLNNASDMRWEFRAGSGGALLPHP